MRRVRPAALTACALAAGAALAPARAQDGSTGVCGDPSVPARDAVVHCRRALERGGLSAAERARAAANLGAAFLALDRPREALAAYDRARDADPDLALGWAGTARAREALGEIGTAAAAWNRAVDRAPRDPAILTGRGGFRLRAGNFEGALADFETARRRAPDPALDFNRGLALAALERDAEAERAFSAVIRATPGDAAAWLNRARLRVSRDRAAALGDFDAAVERAPEWAVPVFERGLLREAMGRQAAADEDYRRAWELGLRNEFLNARMLRMGRG